MLQRFGFTCTELAQRRVGAAAREGLGCGEHIRAKLEEKACQSGVENAEIGFRGDFVFNSAVGGKGSLLRTFLTPARLFAGRNHLLGC